MKLEIKVDYERGGQEPKYAKDLDAGADVYCPVDVNIEPGETVKICLEFSIKLPNGYVGFILPRSGNASNGIHVAAVPIDPSYSGKIHAIVTNFRKSAIVVQSGTRIAQLVILPFVRVQFVNAPLQERGLAAFGSTGE